MDSRVGSFYFQWKSKYIRKSCDAGQYYVWFGEGKTQSVSEGQGYGMVILSLMGGYDSLAHEMYDGLFRYCQAHPSTSQAALMAWAQTTDCKNLEGSSAADGDFDIAYSLLLANEQWGSLGSVNYLAEAKIKIAALVEQEINPSKYSILLSDDIKSDSEDFSDMRTSDFMPAHCKAFGRASGDDVWKKVVDNSYSVFQSIEKEYSKSAGLLPDFIQWRNHRMQPALPKYLESRYDGQYNFNACRVPWRLATDYLVYGDARAHALLTPLNAWIRETTTNDPDNISAGYNLEGEDLPGRNFEALCFICPFAVSAMIDAGNQHWLNALWKYIIHFQCKDFDYYDNTIKMINILILSGNYWSPAQV